MNFVGDLLQPSHLIFILVIALLVLGPTKLPEVGRSLGRGLRDFRDAISGDDRDRIDLSIPVAPDEATPPQAATAQQPPQRPHEPAEHAG
jgi:sec-independent protein translocase protein TatA